MPNSSDTATILIMHPDRVEVLQRPANQPPKYKELRKWIGNVIEPVYLKEDPMGLWSLGYVDEESLVKRLPVNAEASRLFPQYPGGLRGPCVFLEGFHSWWWIDEETQAQVRPATKRECLEVSNGKQETREIDGRKVYLSEYDEDDDES
jgi:hypothetical protein